MSYTFFSDQDWKYAADLIKVLEGANQQVPLEVRDMALRGGLNHFESVGGGRWDSSGRRGGARDGGFAGRGGKRDAGFGLAAAATVVVAAVAVTEVEGLPQEELPPQRRVPEAMSDLSNPSAES